MMTDGFLLKDTPTGACQVMGLGLTWRFEARGVALRESLVVSRHAATSTMSSEGNLQAVFAVLRRIASSIGEELVSNLLRRVRRVTPVRDARHRRIVVWRQTTFVCHSATRLLLREWRL